MNNLYKFPWADLWLGALDMPSIYQVSPFTENATFALTLIGFQEMLLLARKYMVASRPQAARVLSSAIAVELFFLETINVVGFLGEAERSETLEQLFLSEITQRNADRESLLHLTTSIKRKKARLMFLRWVVDDPNVSLERLLLLRQKVLISETAKGQKSIQDELDIIDERIKTSLVTSLEEEVERVLTSIKVGAVKEHELPRFFLPLTTHLFPHL